MLKKDVKGRPFVLWLPVCFPYGSFRAQTYCTQKFRFFAFKVVAERSNQKIKIKQRHVYDVIHIFNDV